MRGAVLWDLDGVLADTGAGTSSVASPLGELGLRISRRHSRDLWDG